MKTKISYEFDSNECEDEQLRIILNANKNQQKLDKLYEILRSLDKYDSYSTLTINELSYEYKTQHCEDFQCFISDLRELILDELDCLND
jgi:hypothetical protein